MFLIVGLGNPGRVYASTRHNLGFSVTKKIAKLAGIAVSKPGHKAKYGTGLVEDNEIVLAMPQTFVNLSGQSVKALLAWLGIPPASLLVIYDDLDLPFGEIKLKRAGGSGGHNGVESIIRHLKTDDFSRLKVGIGRPPLRQDPAEYVLKPFSNPEKRKLNFILERAAEAALLVVREGIEKAMNEYNIRKGQKL